MTSNKVRAHKTDFAPLFIWGQRFVWSALLISFSLSTLASQANEDSNRQTRKKSIRQDDSNSSSNPNASRSVRLLVGGDVLAHTRVKESAARNGTEEQSYYGFLFEPVRDLIENADIAFANLETPVSSSQPNRIGGFTFNAPNELLSGLKWAGFDILSLANNHSLDQRLLGLRETLEATQSSGLTPVGVARSREEALAGHIRTVRGIRIGFLAFADFINGGDTIIRTSQDPYLNLSRRTSDLYEAIESMRQRADIVVLSLHWGVEYESKPRPWQTRLAEDLHERGVDVLVGHHPHVLQPIQWYRTRSGRLALTIFSLGNLVSNQSSAYSLGRGQSKDALTRDGVLIELHLNKNGIRGFRPHPIWTSNWRGFDEGIQTISIERELKRLNDLIETQTPSPYRSFLLEQRQLLTERRNTIYHSLKLPLRATHAN